MNSLLRSLLLATGLVLAPVAMLAAEQGEIIRAGELMAEPFIDAKATAKVKPKQPVAIIERKGGWIKVEAGSQSGWVRMLNVRLAEGQGARRATSSTVASLRTGSTGQTATTGIKGLDEEDIRNAVADYTQLAELDRLAVDDAEARQAASGNSLSENEVDYLDARGGR